MRGYSVRRAFYKAESDGEGESAWAGTAGIEVKYVVGPGNFRLVRVAEDHGGNACGRGMQINIFAAMDDVEEFSSEFHGLGERQCAASTFVVDIAADRGDGSDGLQRVEDSVVTYIACVEDMGAAGERLQSFWTQQAVSVGDDSNSHIENLSQFFPNTDPTVIARLY